MPGRLAVGRQVLALEVEGSNPSPAAQKKKTHFGSFSLGLSNRPEPFSKQLGATCERGE